MIRTCYSPEKDIIFELENILPGGKLVHYGECDPNDIIEIIENDNYIIIGEEE